MRKLNYILCLLITLIPAFALSACGNEKQNSYDASTHQVNADVPLVNEAAEPSTLVYGSGDYSAINPALYEHGEINSLLFLGLTTHDENNQVIPGLAETWTWDEPTLTYVFTLRDNLTFHDGAPLTSADVKFTFDVIQNEANGSENISNYEDILSIGTPDDRTVVFTLSAPNAAMPHYLSMGILPRHLLEGANIITDEFNRHPVGAGPYQFVSWAMGQSITMEKFDSFCLGTPQIERIVFKIVENDQARALQLKSGELDLAQISPKDAVVFQSDDRFDLYTMDTADYRGILYNFKHPFWHDNPGLPAALSYAIDRDAIIRSVLLGQGQAAYSPLQKGEYNHPNIEKYEYDPEKAKAEIEKLGWSMGGDGFYQKNQVPLAFTICAPSSDQVRIDMANICVQNLRDVGVNAALEISQNIDWAGQQAYLIGWGSPFDPDDHTYKVFGTEKGANYSGYSNPQVDELLTQARARSDQSERLLLYQKFQEELAKDPAYTFITYIDTIYIARKGISGITTDTVLGHHGVGIFRNIWEWSK